MRFVLALGMSFLGGGALAQTNLIQNPGFEGGFFPTGIASNWNNNSFGSNTVEYAVDSATPHSGGYAQRIFCSAYSDGALQFPNATEVPVLKSRAYEVKAWLKGDVTSTVTLQLRKWGSPYTDFCSRSFVITPEWKEYAFVDFAAGTDPAARLFIFFSSTGTLYVDDVSCQRLPTSYSPPAVAIPDTLFGMHMHRAWYKTPWPYAAFKVWRLWDAYATWDRLEPTEGAWDFSRLDIYFELAKTHGADLVIPIAHSPVWASARPTEMGPYGPGISAEPADTNDWKNYVRTVGEYCRDHSQGRARYFEIWNEPGFYPGSFFSGTQEKLVELSELAYVILKEIDPSYQVISSSIVMNSDLFDSFMGKGATNWCDIVGYHFYNAQPEKALTEMGRVKQIMIKHGIADKPLWNTEAGWLVQGATETNGISLPEAGDYILRSYILNWANGIPVYCFYSWDSGTMGPLEMVWDGSDWAPSGEKPFMAQGYRTANDWLIGAVMNGCSLDSTTATWTVELTRDGQSQMIVWNPDTNADFEIDPGWGFTTLQTIDEKDSSIDGVPSISVGGSPVLLKGPPSVPPTAPHGTSIAWLQSKGFTNGYAAAELIDPDNDGAWVWEEYFAGTDPTNAASVFRILQAGSEADQVSLKWYGTTNNGVTNGFEVFWCVDISTGVWQLAASNISRSNDGTNSYTGTNSLPASFYRVAVPTP